MDTRSSESYGVLGEDERAAIIENGLKAITKSKNDFNNLDGVTVVGVFYDKEDRYIGKGLVKEFDGHHTHVVHVLEKATSPKTAIFIQQPSETIKTRTFIFKALGPFSERFYLEK